MTGTVDESTFEKELRAPGGPDLIRANLLFAREIAYPGLKPSRYLETLDAWAERVAPSCEDGSLVERARCLSSFLFQEVGLRGNEEDYYDPSNSYLNAVMDRRQGLPISLSVLYIEMARRVGLRAFGVGLPGHFIVGVKDPGESCLLDPYHGGMLLTRDDAAALVRSVTGFGGSLEPGWLEPVGVQDILIRMLLNLRGSYLRREDWSAAILVLERLRLLQPKEAGYLRDMGLICQRAGALRRATEYLSDYLVIAADAPDADVIRQTLNALHRQAARLN